VTEKVIIPGLSRAHREWKSAQTSERLAQLEVEWAEEVHLFDTPEYAAMIKARADAEWDAL